MYKLKLTISIPMLLLAFILATIEPATTPWTLKELLLGLGLAIILKGIEYFIRRYIIFWAATDGIGSFKDFENKR